VLDTAGAVIPGATITLHRISTAGTRTAHTAPDGRFVLAGLPPGGYRVEISSPGFFDLSSGFTLKERDRALLSAALDVGSAAQTVMVEAAPPPMAMGVV